MFGSGKGILFRRDCQQKFMEIFLLLLLFPRPSRTNDFACKCISSVFWRKGVEDRWHAVAHGWTKPQKLKFFIWPIQKLRKCFVYFRRGYFGMLARVLSNFCIKTRPCGGCWQIRWQRLYDNFAAQLDAPDVNRLADNKADAPYRLKSC